MEEQWRMPGNNSGNSLSRNAFAEFHPRNPRNSLYPDQTHDLESLFSSLSLQGDRFSMPPSLRVPPVNSTVANLLDDEFLMGFRAQESLNNAAQSQGLIRAQNGIDGAHQNLNVGPGLLSLPGAGIRAQPWCFAEPCSEDDYLRLNYEVANYNGGYPFADPFLPNTAPLIPREPIGQFPLLSYNYTNNYLGRNLNFGSPNYWGTSNSKFKYNLSAYELRGKVVHLAKDQQGSKLLQARLERGNIEEIRNVLSELIDSIGDLMKSQPGSYVIQKLFVVCNEEQRMTIIQAIIRNTHQFIGICFSQHGARAMQKLLDNLSTPQQRSLILSAITPVAVALTNDQNGQHVIQYCVKTFSIEYTKHLLNEIANNCFEIATQKSGCCVLQSCVESACGELKDRLITEILTNAVQLSEDQYGNYVVQHLVGQNLPRVIDTLLDRLQGNFVTLSCNKYASNVVEKIIVESREDQSTRVITELLRSSCASMLLVDAFGNFVIQKALNVAKGHVLAALFELIEMNAASMRCNVYGKKILDRLANRKDFLHHARFYKLARP